MENQYTDPFGGALPHVKSYHGEEGISYENLTVTNISITPTNTMRGKYEADYARTTASG
jgi:hypothetical protein